jgi:D-glycero-alpha-D-manno-heptose-7-phosphate kinase
MLNPEPAAAEGNDVSTRRLDLLQSRQLCEDLRIALAQQHGAEAAKVSGAGGGGFILFMTHPSRAIQLRRTLLEAGGETTFCCLSEHGAQAWRI